MDNYYIQDISNEFMPGISILRGGFGASSMGNHEADHERMLLAALDSVMHNDRYTQKILLKKKSFWVACTKYPEYPITIYEDDHFWVCIEGKIYGQDDAKIKKEINALLFEVSVADKSSDKRYSAVDKWLSKTDGEFIIYALNKRNNEFVLINDILGRLPIYYHKDDSRLIISRELPFIACLIWHSDDNSNLKNQFFDRMAIAQYLLFGYTLDKRTLINDIYRMQPGTLARISDGKNGNYEDRNHGVTYFKMENLFSFNFEQKKYADESQKYNVDTLVSLFSESCKNRADLYGNNIISLSGGFDSRLVAACFHKNNIPYRGVTYRELGWKPLLGNRSESEIAKKVSDIFGLDWKDYGPIRAKAKDFLTLLRAKLGSVSLGYSFMLPFLETLKKESLFDTIFITGDGGGRIFANPLPPKENGDMDELVYSIIDNESFVSLSDVSKLVQIDEESIVNELKRILLLYPEKELDQKYVHFIIYSACFAIFEVEEMARLYLWHTSPFFSIPVIEYAMNCSDVNKSFRALHREILMALSPSAAALDNSDYGCSITSYKFKVVIPFLRSIIFRYPTLKKIAARIVRNKNSDVLDDQMIKCLKDQMKSCKHLSRYFSTAKLYDMANNPEKYGLHAVYHLFTMVSLIEKIYSNSSTIERYYD